MRFKLQLTLIAFTVLFTPFIVSADTEIYEFYSIDDEETWTLENSPYIVKTNPFVGGQVSIRDTGILNIEAGVVVKVQGNSSGATKFVVNGKLNILGTEGSPVLMTAYADDGSENLTINFNDRWGGIIFNPGSEGNINYLSEKYTGHVGYQEQGGPGITNSGGSVNVNNSSFSGHHIPILMDSGQMNLDNVSLFDNSSALLIHGGDLSMTNSTISDSDDYGLLVTGSGSFYSRNNTFVNNVQNAVLRLGVHYDIADSTFIGGGLDGFRIGGEVDGDVILNKIDSVLVVDGISINNGGNLTITDGNILKMNNGSVVYNNGQLNILGTTDEPVFIVSTEDDSIGGDTNYDGDVTFPKNTWHYGIITNPNGVTNINNAVIRHGGQNLGFNRAAALHNLGGVLNVSDSDLSKNYGGVYQDGGMTNLEKVTIDYHNGVGIVLYGGDLSVNNSRFLVSQSTYGIRNYGSETVQAQNNWWGDASGPYHDPNNLNGTGSTIIGNVNFEPWLISDPAIEPPTEECCSSVLFLPGFQASTLYKGGEKVWLPGLLDNTDVLEMDENGEPTVGGIQVGEIVEEAYLGVNIYKSFAEKMQELVDSGTINNWTPFAYDWRYGVNNVIGLSQQYLDGESKNLANELRELASSSRTGKVAITAHSNGGLVAKHLIYSLGEEASELIDSLIMVGTPQVGTPKAIGALLHGFDSGLPLKSFPLTFSSKEARSLGENMPGAYGLLPSRKYFDLVGSSPIKFKGNSILGYGDQINDFDEMSSFLIGTEGRLKPLYDDLNSPNILNDYLLSKTDDTHSIIDELIIPESIMVHQIAGWGEETVSGIEYYQGKKSECVNNDLRSCTQTSVLKYKPEIVIDGDGTVVTPSALVVSVSSPNVKRWWVNLEDYNEENIDRDHKNLLEIPELNQFIENIISTHTPELPLFVESTQPPSSSPKRLRFTLHSPLDLYAINTQGEVISSTESSIEGARYERFGELQYISIPADIDFTLKLDGYESGSFDLDIEEVLGNLTIATTTFEAIPTTDVTKASITFSDGTIENASSLTVDYDGDEAIDIYLQPEVGKIVTLSPIDNISPEAIVSFSTNTNSVDIVGKDDTTTYPIVVSNPASTVVNDESENSITLTHEFLNTENHREVTITNLLYSTSTIISVDTNTKARYFWKVNLKNEKYVFNVHIYTPKENLVAVYNPSKNSTKIILVPNEVTIIDIEGVENNLPEGGIIKETISGLVIPYLETNKGEINIKY